MAMNGTFLDLLAAEASSTITHVGLVDAGGTELASASYARQAVTWDGPTSGDGKLEPDSNLVFEMTSGDVVAGWRGYSAASAGTEYGGKDFGSNATFGNDGQFTVNASGTFIDINAVA